MDLLLFMFSVLSGINGEIIIVPGCGPSEMLVKTIAVVRPKATPAPPVAGVY